MPSSERKQSLIEYASNEFERFKAGEIPRTSTSKELAEIFGYKSHTNINSLLRKSGVERGGIESEKPYILPTPSRELSWFLGTLCGGGNVAVFKGLVRLESEHESLRDEFKTVGEALFGVDAHQKAPKTSSKNNGHKPTVHFYSRPVAEFIGDVRSDNWPTTLNEQHEWIAEKKEFIISFLEGYFNKSGQIYKLPQNHHRLILSASSIEAGNYLSDLLTKIGITNLSIRKRSKSDNKIAGVTINKLSDIRLFAQQIQSVITKKEEVLEYYRNRTDKRGKKPTYSNEEILDEWIKIKEVLGHSPSITDIRKLKKAGFSSISTIVYVRRYGGDSFVKARENIERILAEKLQESTIAENGQIFP